MELRSTVLFVNLLFFIAGCDEATRSSGSGGAATAGTAGLGVGGSSNAPSGGGAAGSVVGGVGGLGSGADVGGSAGGAATTGMGGSSPGSVGGSTGLPTSVGGSLGNGGASQPKGGMAGAGGIFPSGTGGTATGGHAGASDGVVRFFLPTTEPDNTAAPTVEVDRAGATHAVYPAYAGGDAYYAYCGPNCSGPSDTKVVAFKTDATVANVMLALTSDGRPRVLLSSFQRLYYATCDADCTKPTNWTQTEIANHQGDREVTGEAFALDPEGHPRFLMHTYRAFLGIGQKAPETYYASCDSNCNLAASWQFSKIADEIWEGTHLRIDAQGRARIATVVRLNDGETAGQKLAAYLECVGDCTTSAAWNGIGFVTPYESEIEAVRVQPTVSLALTKTGKPRVAVLGKGEDGGKNIIYFECDENCTEDNWSGSIISNHAQLSAGLDLAIDGADHPRLVYTLNYNIGLAYCDQAPCAGPDSGWDLTKVELGSDMPPDSIFLWENCTVGAWFLHSPSIALTEDGRPRVGYQARDISGGFSQPDPTKPRCVAGTDMTWSRMAIMPSHRATQ